MVYEFTSFHLAIHSSTTHTNDYQQNKQQPTLEIDHKNNINFIFHNRTQIAIFIKTSISKNIST